jgi:Asp-tRNA(Asn)/Glu-tRNA(Gln) amidotransferase A subunit family amidase
LSQPQIFGGWFMHRYEEVKAVLRDPAVFSSQRKPPWGRVPEVWPWNREWYAASGPMARTVGDSALFENAMAGPLEADMFSLEPYRLPEPVPSGRGMRVAVSAELGYFDVAAEVTDAL